MILQDVWPVGSGPASPWWTGIPDGIVGHVERWHSESHDPGSPWIEWRWVDQTGRIRVRWRERDA
jgi:hypothetical protein